MRSSNASTCSSNCVNCPCKWKKVSNAGRRPYSENTADYTGNLTTDHLKGKPKGFEKVTNGKAERATEGNRTEKSLSEKAGFRVKKEVFPEAVPGPSN